MTDQPPTATDAHSGSTLIGPHLTKRDLLDVLATAHDDTIICIDTPAGLRTVVAVTEQSAITGPSEVSAVIALAPEESR